MQCAKKFAEISAAENSSQAHKINTAKYSAKFVILLYYEHNYHTIRDVKDILYLHILTINKRNLLFSSVQYTIIIFSPKVFVFWVTIFSFIFMLASIYTNVLL